MLIRWNKCLSDVRLIYHTKYNPIIENLSAYRQNVNHVNQCPLTLGSTNHLLQEAIFVTIFVVKQVFACRWKIIIIYQLVFTYGIAQSWVSLWLDTFKWHSEIGISVRADFSEHTQFNSVARSDSNLEPSFLEWSLKSFQWLSITKDVLFSYLSMRRHV